MPGIAGVKQPLPPHPLNGMVNKTGGKVRLTFKLEEDSLWIGTKGKDCLISYFDLLLVLLRQIHRSILFTLVSMQLISSQP